MAKLSHFDQRRRRVRTSLRAKGGTRPRLSIHRSGRHIYAQVIDDAAGKTLAAASTLDKDVRKPTGSATSDAAAEMLAPALLPSELAAATVRPAVSSMIWA